MKSMNRLQAVYYRVNCSNNRFKSWLISIITRNYMQVMGLFSIETISCDKNCQYPYYLLFWSFVIKFYNAIRIFMQSYTFYYTIRYNQIDICFT